MNIARRRKEDFHQDGKYFLLPLNKLLCLKLYFTESPPFIGEFERKLQVASCEKAILIINRIRDSNDS